MKPSTTTALILAGLAENTFLIPFLAKAVTTQGNLVTLPMAMAIVLPVLAFKMARVAMGLGCGIAVGRGRTSGLFTLKDSVSGGGHSYLKFRAARSYHNQEGTALNILQHSRYGNPTFGAVRICHDGRTYDEYFLDVYVCAATRPNRRFSGG